jgi:serine/threonine-protein kinase
MRRPSAVGTLEWQRAGDALASLLDLPEGEGAAWLDALDATDPLLRREVESLLDAHRRSGPLDEPLMEILSIDAVEAERAARREWERDTGDAIAERYRSMEAVGGGGMGVVFKAWDQRLGRPVALKFLPSHLLGDAGAREQLWAEARAAAAVDHPNICTIYEVGEAPGGRVFIAMPYYDGETLAARLARGPLCVEDALSLTLQIARGLAKTHENGVIHRDIKPANLIVTSGGVLMILDFGIAKRSGATTTLAGRTAGTAAYMSPEQTRGDVVDARTDLWSLGVVLYEMLTGVRPFRGVDARAVGVAVCAAEVESVSARRGDVPLALDQLVRALLAKDPGDRPACAAVVAQRLCDLAP